MEPDKDRIERAWELRAAIHAWLRSNQGAQMVELFAAFPYHKRETIRQTVSRMRKAGNVAMSGAWGQQNCTYRALGDGIPPASETRRRMSEAGKINIHIATAAWKKPVTKKEQAKLAAQQKRDERAAKKAAQAAKAAMPPEQVVGGKFTYNSGDNPAIGRFRSGGQGAVREKVTINCFQLF